MQLTAKSKVGQSKESPSQSKAMVRKDSVQGIENARQMLGKTKTKPQQGKEGRWQSQVKARQCKARQGKANQCQGNA
jgi:hypothetical protein